MAGDFETCAMRFFDGDREQFFIEWNIGSTFRTRVLIPTIERNFNPIRASLNLCLNRGSQFIRIAKLAGERNIRPSMRDPCSRRMDVRSA